MRRRSRPGTSTDTSLATEYVCRLARLPVADAMPPLLGCHRNWRKRGMEIGMEELPRVDALMT